MSDRFAQPFSCSSAESMSKILRMMHTCISVLQFTLVRFEGFSGEGCFSQRLGMGYPKLNWVKIFSVLFLSLVVNVIEFLLRLSSVFVQHFQCLLNRFLLLDPGKISNLLTETTFFILSYFDDVLQPIRFLALIRKSNTSCRQYWPMQTGIFLISLEKCCTNQIVMVYRLSCYSLNPLANCHPV